MREDFERTSLLVNGYFYIAEYYNMHHRGMQQCYDVNPLIFVLGPWKRNQNCIVAVNFHHIADINARCQILKTISDIADISRYDIRAVEMTESVFRSKFSFANDAIRIYNRKSLREVYRIKSNRVGRYIDCEGNFLQASPSTIMNKYWLNYAENTTVAAKHSENEVE